MKSKISEKEKQLRQLQELLEAEVITEEEFGTRKKEIIFDKIDKKEKVNALLVISCVLSIAYLIFSLVYWINVGGDTTSDLESISTGLAIVFVFPHYFLTFLALIFNAIGAFTKKRGFVLTGAILYTVAMVSLPVYFFFVVIQMILSYIGYAQMKKE